MPRIKGTTGSKKPYERVLEVMKLNEPITPSAIDAYVGTGNYSSKYICFLKRDGHQINILKDGRNVISYTLVSKSDKVYVSADPKVIKVKAVKVKSAVEKTPEARRPALAAALKKFNKKNTLPAKKPIRVPATKVGVKIVDFDNLPTETSYMVDGAFDETNIDDLNLG